MLHVPAAPLNANSARTISSRLIVVDPGPDPEPVSGGSGVGLSSAASGVSPKMTVGGVLVGVGVLTGGVGVVVGVSQSDVSAGMTTGPRRE